MNMSKWIIVGFLFFTMNAVAENCTFSVDKSSVKLKWTAFKTTQKIGVSGSFKKIEWETKPGPSISRVLSSTKFNIKTKSMNSGSWIRDRRVYKNFFKIMENGTKITGYGISYSEEAKKAVIEVNMNNERTPVVFDTVFEKDNSFVLKGSIDVLKHFKMKKSYEKIAKLCEKLHTGTDGVAKTWTDVDLEITGKLNKVCK